MGIQTATKTVVLSTELFVTTMCVQRATINVFFYFNYIGVHHLIKTDLIYELSRLRCLVLFKFNVQMRCSLWIL
jgi:hypothetical protein